MSNERHFVMLFEYALIALMEQDFSAIRLRLEALRAQGVTDLGAHLETHPEEIEAGMAAIQALRVNHQTLALYGAQSKEELLANLGRLLRNEMRHHFREELLALWQGKLTWEGEGINYTLTGQPVDVLLSWRILPGAEQTWNKVLVSIEDITRRKQAERALQASDDRLRGLFENAPISLWEEDYSRIKTFFDSLRQEGVDNFRAYLEQRPEAVLQCMQLIRVLDVNRETLRLFGARSKEQLLANLDKVFRDEMQEHFREELIRLWDGELAYAAEGVNYTLRGEPLYVHLHLSVYPGSERNFERVLVALEDITARRKAEEYLRYLGTHDALTGLYNRAYYQEELKRLSGGRYYPVSILIADMDGLKQVNDTLGHEAGDGLIRRAAEVLQAGFRQEDVVARIGGDEFAIVMPQTDAETAKEAIERLQVLSHMNNKFYGKPLLSLSLGSATSAEKEDLESVTSRADDAMYRMKREHHRSG